MPVIAYPPSLFGGSSSSSGALRYPATTAPTYAQNPLLLPSGSPGSPYSKPFSSSIPAFGGGGGGTQRYRNVTIIPNRGGGGRPSLPAGTVPYKQLAELVNSFMTQQAVAPYIANLPDYTGMTQQRSANIGSQLAGQVSPSTTNLLAQRGAERGIGVGAGGPNAAAAWLAALGLTSEGLQQQGQQNLSQAIADTPVPEIWNPMSLYVPEYLANLELQAARGSGGGQALPNVRRRTPWNAPPGGWPAPVAPIGTIPGWA